MGPTGERAIFQVHPTRRCNLRCLHCYSQSGPDVGAVLGLDVLAEAVADAAALGYDVLGVSGGEPMLYQHLIELLGVGKALGMRTTVTSNGWLLTERRLAELSGLVDILAVSLDGAPESHVRMRGDPRAFERLDRRMPAVRDSGITFGLITTLTLHNVHELAFVVDYAVAHGAGLVQVHPLESAGAAVVNLAGSVPDEREASFAFLEAARLSAAYGLPIQVDLTRRADLMRHPEHFLAAPPPPGASLGSWLTPLVLETDGTTVPVTYGFSRVYALGNVNDRPLRDLAVRWDPDPFRQLCRDVHARLATGSQRYVNWYEELAHQANGQAFPGAAAGRVGGPV
ncbi:MoaA/NifB/PqqE/SkfB family radical SAM enzyme [Nonomuraea polychroma]|uniref:MoaA/NifB/PqqE/SkfB family radical SAM enzyme n=1 Tax=Nonomuraea polychroma TaxID=46176 RepID=A0A438MAH6_9ACTN|nr:radical SAM protein [Nonomuraea polychroma]RVX42723.1 MoaA/NifB/PqqE/SkfB family radical SAM enzyme [Nonomuraea polychroma]